jgi:uncharacterized pyridoxamine 5'-phosphate oxidase family protein
MPVTPGQAPTRKTVRLGGKAVAVEDIDLKGLLIEILKTLQELVALEQMKT